MKLEVGKWVFLWVVLAETASLALALVMRCMGRLEGRYENLELEEANRLHDMELQSIGRNMTGSAKVTNKLEDRCVPPTDCCLLCFQGGRGEGQSKSSALTAAFCLLVHIAV